MVTMRLAWSIALTWAATETVRLADSDGLLAFS
jgi:hypothetical protein